MSYCRLAQVIEKLGFVGSSKTLVRLNMPLSDVATATKVDVVRLVHVLTDSSLHE